MQAAHSATLRRVRSISSRALTMSAIASRPPGRSARAAAPNTASLSGARLTTPLEITTSTLAGLDRRVLDQALDERDVLEAERVAQPARLGQLRVGHVDADHAAGRAR